MALERICPACGASSTKRPFAGDWCADCYFKKKMEGWPAQFELQRCVKCGRIWNDSKWKTEASTLIAAIAKAKMGKFERSGYYNVEAMKWEGVFDDGGEKIPFAHPLVVDYQKTICPDCNQAHSNYFEGIIQLRGDRMRLERAARRLIKRIERKTFIPKIEEMHGGLDIYIGIKKDIAAMLQEEGYDFVRSEKLAGQKQGKRLYRSSFLVRLDLEGVEDPEPEVKVPKREGVGKLIKGRHHPGM